VTCEKLRLRISNRPTNTYFGDVLQTGRLKMQDWKMRDRNAGVENEGPSRYGKPNVALCNVYPPLPRIRSCISVRIPALLICAWVTAK